MNATLEPQPIVIVEGAGSAFAQHITAGVHDIVADESIAAGGHDGGPSPYQLLLGALGSCTSITLGSPSWTALASATLGAIADLVLGSPFLVAFLSTRDVKPVHRRPV